MTTQRIFCIGRNYAEHVRELGNEEGDPVIFMKPATCLVTRETKELVLPADGDLDYETELVVEIGKTGRAPTEAEAPSFIRALGVGFDLTRRVLQKELLSRGLPWERCKAFDNSAPLGELTDFDPAADDLKHLRFSGYVNGELRQSGDTTQMIFPIARLIVEISRDWTLLPGDLIYTGTPKGIGRLHDGDILSAMDHRGKLCSWTIRAAL